MELVANVKKKAKAEASRYDAIILLALAARFPVSGLRPKTVQRPQVCMID